ncbi:ThuA domain-containing protein [bacterium]|nr:ThuA domain-containing protein [bacterium]
MRRVITTLALALLSATTLLGCGSSSAPQGGEPVAGTPDGPLRVLVFSRTAGFRHASIEAGILAVQTLGQDNGFEVDATEDPEQFTADNLANYTAVIWLNTTLDVLNDVQQQAFEAYVRGGGGYVGVHAAADTEHDWPFYGELVGAQFLTHPLLNQPGTLRLEDDEHPSTAHLPSPWQLPLEEYYTFGSTPRGEVRVLLNIDESSYMQEPNISCDPSGPTFPQGYNGRMGDHPMAWCHDKFAGRAWYTALGHEIYLYQDTDFLDHLLGGILTVLRVLPANCAVDDPAGLPAYEPPMLEGCQGQIIP